MPVRCSGAPKIVLPPPLGRGQRRLPQVSCTCATPCTRTTEPLATARRQLAIASALLCRCRCRPAHARARHRCHGVAPRAVAFALHCDAGAAEDAAPDAKVTESNPGGHYQLTWRHPAACDRGGSAANAGGGSARWRSAAARATRRERMTDNEGLCAKS